MINYKKKKDATMIQVHRFRNTCSSMDLYLRASVSQNIKSCDYNWLDVKSHDL